MFLILEESKTINAALRHTYWHIVAMRKPVWRAVLVREIYEMPLKWRSVRPRNVVHNWTFWVREELFFILYIRKH